MNKIKGFFLVLFFILSAVTMFAQTPKMVTRTITKTDRFDFGVGGTVAITGAPAGSVRVTGWQKNEIEITAEIELQAPTEGDIDKLAEVTGFVTDESLGRTGIISIGTHDKKYLKKSGKKLPKNLLGLPFRINYTINVPRYCDLEIDGGKGDLAIGNVEGSMRINFLESKAQIEVINGAANITIGTGDVDIVFGLKGWRGRSATVALATGNLNIRLPSNLSAEIDAVILKTGAIDNKLADLKPRDRKVPLTDRSIIAKAGVGGPPLKFTVGDGTLKLDLLRSSL